jgi:hypothetical protein
MEKYVNDRHWAQIRHYEIRLLGQNKYPKDEKLQELLNLASCSNRLNHFYFLYFAIGTNIKFEYKGDIPPKLQKEIDEFFDEQRKLGYY